MNGKKNKVRENPVMIEELESRELYSVSALPAVQCPSDPGPTSSRLVVVTTTQPPTTNVVISIIAVLIGL